MLMATGRALSRTAARGKVTEREFRKQMEGIWYDSRLAARLRDDAPSAYKDIRSVLRAQKGTGTFANSAWTTKPNPRSSPPLPPSSPLRASML